MSGSRTSKKAQVITHLLTGKTVSVAAQHVDIAEHTVFRWLNEPGFVEELHTQERQMLNACSWRLISMTKNTLNTLQNVMKEPDQPGATNKRLASAAILKLTLKYINVLTFEERLKHLKKQVFNKQ